MHCNSIHIIALFISAFIVCNAFANSGGGGFFLPDDEHPTTARYPESDVCYNAVPQPSLDITQILGPWYGSEVIFHTDQMPYINQYNFCVHVSILDVTDQTQLMLNSMRERQYKDNFNRNNNNNNNNNNRRYEDNYSQTEEYVPTRYLRLVWMENNDNLEYSFNYTLSSPSIWVSNGKQRGTLSSRHKYTQFNGTVQVLKAVHDHIVLTFCGRDDHSASYTMVLTRNITGLKIEDVRGIRNLLSRRQLPIGRINKVCSSAVTSTTPMAKALAALLLCVCILIVGRRAI